MSQNIKLKDVAGLANVSVASVSRYLNNPMILREETRVKIQKALQQTDYTPNRVAAGLRTKKTHTIALIIPGLSNLYYVDMCSAVHDSVSSRDYCVNLYMTEGNNDLLLRYLNELPSRLYDGAIICHLDDDDVTLGVLESVQRSMPMVLLTASPDRMQFNNVIVDVFDGVKKATEHLIEIGKNQIAFVAGSDTVANAEKIKGFKAGLLGAGIEIDPNMIINSQSNNFMGGYFAMRKFMESGTLPDGIVCATDDIAIGCLKQCHNNKLKLPEDIAIIGFNGIALLDTYQPSISSVYQPMQAIANALSTILFESINSGSSRKQTRLFSCELIQRESTTPKNG